MALMLALTCGDAMSWHQYTIASAWTMHQVLPGEQVDYCRNRLLAVSLSISNPSTEQQGCTRMA